MTGVPPLGPFETERDALGHPAVRAVYDASGKDPGPGKMQPRNHRLLCEAVSAAGIALGAYDHRIVSWLSTWEPATVAVVAGMIGRAWEAGWVARAHAPGGAAAVAGVADPAAVTVPGLLHAAADSLAVDLAVWAARDPAAPSPAARQARRSAVAAASAVIVSLSALRSRLEGDRQ
jgi:hypothetical protein